MKADPDFFLMDRTSPDVFKDVALFTEIAQKDMLVEKGQIPTQKARELAIALIKEEYEKEYMPALIAYQKNPTQENLVKVVDGAMDSIYVIAWAMRVFNVPAQAAWNEVQRSNMAKFRELGDSATWVPPVPHPMYGDTPFIYETNTFYNCIIIRNAETGKVMKPIGWTEPRLSEVILQDTELHHIRSRPDVIADGWLRQYFLATEERMQNAK